MNRRLRILRETKELVKKEKEYMGRVLKKLMI
jgi:hypothetical protein